MAQPVIQASFNSGEWAPHLWARVDIKKYHSGAAILENFFVDYRGGVSTRSGTKYVLQAYKSATPVRLIGFQASLAVRYILEFGDKYIRFHQNGSPVLESSIAITAVAAVNPLTLTVANTYNVDDWVYVSGVGGMTQANGKYFIISARDAATITLKDLYGTAINATTWGAYTSGGIVRRVYTLASPYAAADLATLKFCQNVSVMVLCHQSYVPFTLRYSTATSWFLNPITFGTTVGTPGSPSVVTTLGAGAVHYAYTVTSTDVNGQEGRASDIAPLANFTDIRTTPGTNKVTWAAVNGAVQYNVYRADPTYNNPVPAGVSLGYIGFSTSAAFTDSNIAPDFSQTPPIPRNPFAPGQAVSGTTITVPGLYSTIPTVSFSVPGAFGSAATGSAVMEVVSSTINAAGTGYAIGNTVTFASNLVVQVGNIDGGGGVTGYTYVTRGQFAGSLPVNPQVQVSTSGVGVGFALNLSYGVQSIALTYGGQGYITAPTITFGTGAATATATLGGIAVGNPAVPAFFQQRLAFAATYAAPQGLFLSKPGAYFNFDVSNPTQADDAISTAIVSGQLNNIKALVPQPGGLIVLTDGASFLVNGGQNGAPVTPTTISANAQSFLGCNDMPPIVANSDVLYVPSKGSSVRDGSYNFYSNVFTGNDISVLASHLFYGYQLLEWAWTEEPFKVVWAVRSDGYLLSLTFVKEQEFIAWAHHVTTGSFKSVATIVEPATVGYQNFLYTVVERTVQAQTLKYIEYMPERIYPNGVEDAITVDCCYQYSGAPATTFTGAMALSGLTVTGLADGVIIPAFVMAATGSFTLPLAASKVTIGLAFTPKLQTLYLDTGDPTIQSKMKKINAGTVRVTETLGLKIGTDFDHLVDMKDLIRGNVGSMTNEVVTDLVTGDARTFLDPKWQEQGVYCITQPYPYPASILGVIPQLSVGDTPK